MKFCQTSDDIQRHVTGQLTGKVPFKAYTTYVYVKEEDKFEKTSDVPGDSARCAEINEKYTLWTPVDGEIRTSLWYYSQIEIIPSSPPEGTPDPLLQEGVHRALRRSPRPHTSQRRRRYCVHRPVYHRRDLQIAPLQGLVPVDDLLVGRHTCRHTPGRVSALHPRLFQHPSKKRELTASLPSTVRTRRIAVSSMEGILAQRLQRVQNHHPIICGMSISNLFDHLPTPDNVVYISDYKHIQKAVLRDACELSGPQVTASRLEPILDFFNILPDPDEESEYKAVHGEFLTMDRLMMSCPGLQSAPRSHADQALPSPGRRTVRSCVGRLLHAPMASRQGPDAGLRTHVRLDVKRECMFWTAAMMRV